MTITTEQIIAEIIAREGGYVDNPSDHGGPTKYGVTLATLEAFRQGQNTTADDVAALTEDEATQIYQQMFIDGPGFDRLSDDHIRAFMVDWGVNSGPGTAIKHLQGLLPGCIADGILGPNTAKAANLCDPAILLAQLIDLRLAFVQHIAANDISQEKFLDGWEKRIEGFCHA